MSFCWVREDHEASQKRAHDKDYERERESAHTFGNCNEAWPLTLSLSLTHLQMSFVNFIYFAYELEHKTETEQKQRALSQEHASVGWERERETAERASAHASRGNCHGGFPGSVLVMLSMGMYAPALLMCPDNRYYKLLPTLRRRICTFSIHKTVCFQLGLNDTST